MAAFGNFADPAFSGAGVSGGYGAYGGALGGGYGGAAYGFPQAGYAAQGGYGQAAYQVPGGFGAGFAQAAPAYPSLAAYGAQRGGFYQPASYSTSLSGDALAYGAVPFAAQARPAQYSGPVLSGLPAASSYGGVSGGIEQYGANLAPQIEAAYESAAVHRRQPVVRRQVIQVPGNPGQVKQIVRRVPTPAPDVIERVFVVKPQRDVVNLVIERPSTPPPQIKNRTIVAKPRRPVIHSHVVRVAPRSGFQQQVQVQAPPAQVQYVQQPPIQVAPPVAPQYVQQPLNYGYDAAPVYGGYSYSSSSFDTLYGQPQQYGGYSTGFQANYGLPAYGAVSYAQPQASYGYGAYQAAAPAYGGYSGYAAYPGTASNAYSAVYPAQANAYPSIIAANPAGNAYYGVGYPAAGGYAQRW